MTNQTLIESEIALFGIQHTCSGELILVEELQELYYWYVKLIQHIFF